MIGLRFPKLFYGRKQRQQWVGDRADFCEFCVCVCRHHVISFQSAPTVFFVASQFEEFKRESRCEICRTQFPLALSSQYQRLNSLQATPIQELIRNTNPHIIQRSMDEAIQMVQRADQVTWFQRNRIRNFLRMHELEYRSRIRDLFPLIAICSIQALIFGFILFLFVEKWLVFAVVGSAYLLTVLSLFLSARRKILKTFAGGIIRVQAVSELDFDLLDDHLAQESHHWPQVVTIFRNQIANCKSGLPSPIGFEPNEDFVQILAPALAHQKSSQREGA